MAEQSSTANMPRDGNAAPIQALGAYPEVALLSVTSASSTQPLPASCLLIEIACLTAVHFRFGPNGVTAATTDRLLPAGAVVVYVIPDLNPRATHIAMIKANGATDGVCTVGAMR